MRPCPRSRPLSSKHLVLASELGELREQLHKYGSDFWYTTAAHKKKLEGLANSTVYCKYDWQWKHHHVYAKRAGTRYTIFKEPFQVTDQYMLTRFAHLTPNRFRRFTKEEAEKLFWVFL